jgi:hypothetical protein
MNVPTKRSTTNAHREERRKSVRYPITGAVQLRWRGRDGQWYDGIGIARDIGKGGVFIESDLIPPIASTVKLIVTLPAESNSAVTLQLGGVGFVCNVRQELCQIIGFGASAVFHVEVPKSTGDKWDGER